jgi:transcriptional regulator with XRE-family HTH domain
VRKCRVVQRSEEEVRREIGGRIRRARVALGVTIQEFSERAAIHMSQVSRFENGQRLPDAMSLMRLAKALAVTTDWILTGEEGDTSGVVPPPAPRLPPGLDMTLSGFLQAVSESGLARWAATAPKNQSPTLGEALEALEALAAEPAGTGTDRTWAWVPVLQELRGKEPNRINPALFAHASKASARTGELVASLLTDRSEGRTLSRRKDILRRLEELGASVTADGLGEELAAALNSPRFVYSDVVIGLAQAMRVSKPAADAFDAFVAGAYREHVRALKATPTAEAPAKSVQTAKGRRKVE